MLSRAEDNSVATDTAIERVLVDHRSQQSGPTVVAVAGVHGNEPSGIAAVRRVSAWLASKDMPRRGRFVALSGNRSALKIGQRFVDSDFNRVWSSQHVAQSRAGGDTTEHREQAELLAALEQVFAEATGPVHLLDLHTSSAPGQPFVCIGDTLRNREFAGTFAVPVILGLEEQVDGSLLEYVNDLGHVTVGVEAGQHDDSASIEHHTAALLLGLLGAGCLEEMDLPRRAELRAQLADASAGLPPIMEVRYRHAIRPDACFVMQPGFDNFQRVDEGTLLADDVNGEIPALATGRVLLPLYQGLGNDGFFLVRRVAPFWLRLSGWLRRLQLDRIVHWLPGVRRARQRARTLVVEPRIARWLTVELFHLLGYRRERARDGALRFTRRREAPPNAASGSPT